MKWYHFERFFDSNKSSDAIGSRGWGKSIFLHCSDVPSQRRSAMIIYDTLLRDGEYRLSDITILDDNPGVRSSPLLDDVAQQAVSAQTYVTPDGNIKLPLALEPLSEPGTRVVVPYLSQPSIMALRDGSLACWLEYLWWRPIADGRLKITIVDKEQDTCQTIAEPEWWGGEIWSSEATALGEIHRLYQGCHIQILENVQLERDCTVRRLALFYDAKLRDQPIQDDGPDYYGIQMFRAGQSIETYWPSDLIPPKEKTGIRAFVEFDEITDRQLRRQEKAQHDGLYKRGIVKNPILPYLKEKLHEFAYGIGFIKSRDTNDEAPSEEERRTSQFVFDRLLSNAIGDVPDENLDNVAGGETEKPWEIDVLLSYPNPKTSRVDWGERISNIRFVVNSCPETLRRNTCYTLEWQAPGEKYVELWSKTPLKGVVHYGLGYQVLTQHEVQESHIVCPEPGVYRIRAAVYEGTRLVAKKARRVHLEMDPPERQENPYAVSISVENETTPGELRIESGDILSLQLNGRNRTHDGVYGLLHLRMKEGTILASNVRFTMPGKPLGDDDRRHMLHRMRIRLVRDELGEIPPENDIITVTLEPGRRVIQAYLLDDNDTLAFSTHTLYFESEPSRKTGGYPFELGKRENSSPPMWELKMEETKLYFAADYPLYTELPQKSASDSFKGHNAFMLEIMINGLLEWALEPLLEDDSDPTNLEVLLDSKDDLVDDAAWDSYMGRLSELATYMRQVKQGESISPIEFALKWRHTVAAVYQVLKS